LVGGGRRLDPVRYRNQRHLLAAWSRGVESTDAKKAMRKRSAIRKPRNVYCFFDNTDVKLRAPFDAQALMKKLSVA
jgi:uncharacterized protein YecE (DUF72 family)